jgi:methylated-DNA-[protein]-cysteine S-methyltransferase
MNISSYKMPIGTFVIAAEDDAITMVKLVGANYVRPLNPSALTDLAAKQIEDYIVGERRVFDLPLNLKGTEFQRAVWHVLKTIPYGQTRSYKQIAQLLNKPNACRAVGMANNKNPLWIIIPCHRVIGSDGSLVGYGGGLEVKKKLLLLENPYFKEQ